MIKVIVAHPGRQHSFKTASELKNNGMLYKYITTVYDKDSSIIMSIIKKLISGDNLTRASGRKNAFLSDEDVIQFCEIGGFIEIILARYNKRRTIYNWWHNIIADRFGRKVAYYAIKHNVDAVIMYDTNALKAFSVLNKKGPDILRVMDISAANRLYMKNIYEQDFECCKEFASKLKNERKYLWNSNAINRLLTEIKLTQYFISPSNFVKKSLAYSGIKENQIEICPYGANFEKARGTKQLKKHEPLEAVYVGNVTEMKGIYYLLEAARTIDIKEIHLSVVGAYDNSDGKFTQYMNHVSFLGRVSHDKVLEILGKSDFFVFPSLGDGFGLSVLEALACGLPCIVTKNTGADDAIIDEENGFKIDIQDIEAIKEKMLWFNNNREKIPQMSQNAKNTIDYYNWNNHEKKLVSALEKWCNKGEDSLLS